MPLNHSIVLYKCFIIITSMYAYASKHKQKGAQNKDLRLSVKFRKTNSNPMAIIEFICLLRLAPLVSFLCGTLKAVYHCATAP